MKFQDRQKMCSHCDGRIAVEVDACPYCGMPFSGEVETGSPSVVSQVGLSSQESLSSLYPPPYSNRNSSHMKTDKELQSKFKAPPIQGDTPFGKMPYQTAAIAQVAEKEQQQEKSGFMSLLFILLGSNLLTLGLMQGLFSQGGFLRLEWSSKYWVFYCLFALPMIYFGVRKSKAPKETP